jgi:phage terminase large subunit-like protein
MTYLEWKERNIDYVLLDEDGDIYAEVSMTITNIDFQIDEVSKPDTV